MVASEGHAAASGGTALTAVRTLLARDGNAVLLAEPQQGRTHQVRLHLSHAGLPIYGDGKYGGVRGDRVRHALHAASLAVDDPQTGERLSFRAPLPSDMRELIRSWFLHPAADTGPPDPALQPWW